MDELEIRWSIMGRVLAVGLHVADLIYKISLALQSRMHRLKMRFQESLAKELVPCQNSHRWYEVRFRLQVDKPSWTSILAQSKIEWEFTSQTKKTK